MNSIGSPSSTMLFAIDTLTYKTHSPWLTLRLRSLSTSAKVVIPSDVFRLFKKLRPASLILSTFNSTNMDMLSSEMLNASYLLPSWDLSSTQKELFWTHDSLAVSIDTYQAATCSDNQICTRKRALSIILRWPVLDCYVPKSKCTCERSSNGWGISDSESTLK